MNEDCENDVNAGSNDGCSDNCLFENGWTCITIVFNSFCEGICGDGL